MPYISNGQVVESRSPWRLSFIVEAFWGLINFIVLFPVKIQEETDTPQITDVQDLVQVEGLVVQEGELVVLVEQGERQARLPWQAEDEAGRGCVKSHAQGMHVHLRCSVCLNVRLQIGSAMLVVLLKLVCLFSVSTLQWLTFYQLVICDPFVPRCLPLKGSYMKPCLSTSTVKKGMVDDEQAW
ncbi:selenoprotein k [Plakobranchus ocellatus]|uniref:Selenoprotein k n=1 Tax=Plakobranchus ocellatus TaxID=259542 RepID=A0AAV4BLZ9_9GAST|nr:selenoprotein k [Plakobranchus ocellatus]